MATYLDGQRAFKSAVFACDGPRGDEVFDLCGRVPEFFQHVGRLLAEKWRWEIGPNRLTVEVIGGSGKLKSPDPGVIDLQYQILRSSLSILHRLSHVADGTAGNTRG